MDLLYDYHNVTEMMARGLRKMVECLLRYEAAHYYCSTEDVISV